MSDETEAGTQTQDSSSDTIDLGLRQNSRLSSQKNVFSISELTLRSVDERIKQVTLLVLRQVEDIFAPLASQTELECAGDNEPKGSRRNNTSTSPRVTRTTKP